MISTGAIITLIVIVVSIVFFAIEVIAIDLVALLMLVTLILTGVITPEQGIEGFSNKATITVAFMFILSAALLKTGALQFLAHRLAKSFRYNFKLSFVLMLVLIAIISAFINNTPVVAVFIPVMIQIAHASGQSPKKLLIPLSFASIFGGTMTLVGTSTNLMVSGIAKDYGALELTMFDLTKLGIIFLIVGVIYMSFIGIKLLPTDIKTAQSKKNDYITTVNLAQYSRLPIQELSLIKEIGMTVKAIVNKDKETTEFDSTLPLKDSTEKMILATNLEQLKQLKERSRIKSETGYTINGHRLRKKETSLVEVVITPTSHLVGKPLSKHYFTRNFRAVPIALKEREGIIQIDKDPLKAGDVVLLEARTRYISELKSTEKQENAPFILLSEEHLIDFDQRKFFLVLAIIAGVVITAASGVMDIMVSCISGVSLLLLLKVIKMPEAYQSINWKVIMIIACALSLGKAMNNTGLDELIAKGIITQLGDMGPIFVLSGLYLLTSILTELMSNHAAAALILPIALTTAASLGVSPLPFIVAITFAASASFMTPMGYHANTMVYAAGQYKFSDFIKVGTLLNLIFWALATLLIPILYPF